MKTVREFYLERRRAELPVFLRVLRALPEGQMQYKPHERSPSAEQLVWTLTQELAAGVDAAEKGQAEWKVQPAPALSEMIRLFEQRARELETSVEEMDEDSWNRKAQFYFGGKVVSEQPLSDFLWMIHCDAIHHRGQPAAYLRPMGGKVPAIYGPSADERPS